jgi:hypothetical protein
MKRPIPTLELLFATFLAPLAALAAGEDVSKPFADASALPLRPSMPDPLVMLDGTRITTKEDWFNRRRPELKALFQHYMYGAIPPRPERFEAKIAAQHDDLFGGKATMKVITISTGSSGSPRIDLLVIVPKKRAGPAPAFVAMNFCGNHAVIADSRVPLNRGWLYGSCKGCVDGRATEEARGSQAADWAVEATIDRGYALATFASTDVDSDRKDVSDGIYAWLAKESKNAKLAEPASRGTISAWAWGFHRAVDYLVTDPDIDPKRIAAVGHSRNGKTALLAAAFDDRIALAIPHQAGCGGSAPSRGKTGESVQQINEGFPHWFNAEFKKFNEAPERLPFDQHCLVALCAPRPVLFSNAAKDQWANPSGQFDILKAADPVYRFLGAGGLEAKEPPPGKLSDGKLGYYIREGEHSMTAGDWKVFLDFADRHFAAGKEK